MEFIRITHENLETEHICCAIASNKDCQVLFKKAWLKERLDEGLSGGPRPYKGTGSERPCPIYDIQPVL